MNMLLLLQILHTFIAVYNYFCLSYIIYCHLKNISNLFLKIAYVCIGIELLAIIPFKFICPIRIIVDKLYSPETADILFPNPIARLILPVGMGVVGICVLTKIIQIKRNNQAFCRTQKALVRSRRTS